MRVPPGFCSCSLPPIQLLGSCDVLKVAQGDKRLSSEGDKITQSGEGLEAEKQVPEPNGELVLRIPDTARIPEGATFHEGEDDGKCRVIIRGERCRASRMRLYGLCPGHAGRGGIARDPVGASKLAHAERARKKQARLTLGITARRAAQPLQQARIAAQMRALDYAEAIVNKPLDDPELGSIARQTAAIRALELLYPQVTASLDLTMPDEPEQLGAMGWQDMQALATRLLEPGDQQ